MQPLIEASNISVNRQGKDILKEVSVRVETGDFITLQDRNA